MTHNSGPNSDLSKKAADEDKKKDENAEMVIYISRFNEYRIAKKDAKEFEKELIENSTTADALWKNMKPR